MKGERVKVDGEFMRRGRYEWESVIHVLPSIEMIAAVLFKSFDDEKNDENSQDMVKRAFLFPSLPMPDSLIIANGFDAI